jgi:hypothetical protein
LIGVAEEDILDTINHKLEFTLSDFEGMYSDELNIRQIIQDLVCLNLLHYQEKSMNFLV